MGLVFWDWGLEFGFLGCVSFLDWACGVELSGFLGVGAFYINIEE